MTSARRSGRDKGRCLEIPSEPYLELGMEVPSAQGLVPRSDRAREQEKAWELARATAPDSAPRMLEFSWASQA